MQPSKSPTHVCDSWLPSHDSAQHNKWMEKNQIRWKQNALVSYDSNLTNHVLFCISTFLCHLCTKKKNMQKKNAMSALVLPITRRCCLYFICWSSCTSLKVESEKCGVAYVHTPLEMSALICGDYRYWCWRNCDGRDKRRLCLRSFIRAFLAKTDYSGSEIFFLLHLFFSLILSLAAVCILWRSLMQHYSIIGIEDIRE